MTYCCDKYSERKGKGGKVSFWLTVRRAQYVVVCSIVVGLCEAEHHGGNLVWWSKVASLMVTRKQRVREELRTRCNGERRQVSSDLLLPVRYHL